MTETIAYQPGLHRFAVLVTVAVFVMIAAGGMVTSMDAGDAVPDWPLSYNSLLPPMVGNVLYEHGHRMIGWALGLLTITLAVWLGKAESRTWVRRLGYIALAAVCFQGALGGLRVLVVSNESVQNALFSDPTGDRVAAARTTIAIIHTAVGQGILCALAVIAAATSRSWLDTPPPVASPQARGFQILCAVTAAMAFAQLLLGALRRHTDGTIWFHLLGAGVVTFHVALVTRRALVSFPAIRSLIAPAVTLLILVALQVTLGVASWLLTETATANALPRPVLADSEVIGGATLTAHVAIGAAFMALCAVLAVRAHRHLATNDKTRVRAAIPTKGRVAPA